ncbi:hypothetical protein [Teredinibacter sp. KSP-S5-2]|uniref:hypothetical protein n=1 Tax=Teredinibacter sp. KSP-S5-2 TaxID=3034506 RepID=UPI0029341ACD|nr:hypothetical protein [Teredinibacter sp. KSP-S5-2]WNO08881.1 hypothetical protein P5V12_18075 [Teredinibacter sp. KSP-S5-2]
MKAEIILDWDYGTPTLEGLYYAAVKHGEGAGFLEFIEWRNCKWELTNGGEVVAFIDIESFTNQLRIQWPKPAPQPSNSDPEEFEEV